MFRALLSTVQRQTSEKDTNISSELILLSGSSASSGVGRSIAKGIPAEPDKPIRARRVCSLVRVPDEQSPSTGQEDRSPDSHKQLVMPKHPSNTVNTKPTLASCSGQLHTVMSTSQRAATCYPCFQLQHSCAAPFHT